LIDDYDRTSIDLGREALQRVQEQAMELFRQRVLRANLNDTWSA
jgi:hypothetical protein